jgi:hypothetical protein
LLCEYASWAHSMKIKIQIVRSCLIIDLRRIILQRLQPN